MEAWTHGGEHGSSVAVEESLVPISTESNLDSLDNVLIHQGTSTFTR